MIAKLAERCSRELKGWVPDHGETKLAHPQAHAIRSLHPEELAVFRPDLSPQFLLKEKSLTRVADRIQVVEFWRTPTIPIRTRIQLADDIEQFIPYLEANRAALLKTGLPESRFKSAAYLDSRLARLYFVQYATVIKRTSESETTISFMPRFRHMASVPNDYPAVEHSVAPILSGMELKAAGALEELREPILDCKIEMLRIAVAALRTGCADNLLEDVVVNIAKRITAQSVEFLLRADRYFTGTNALGPDEGDPLGADPGGLSSILNFAMWVVKEVGIGSVDKAASILEAHEPPIRIDRFCSGPMALIEVMELHGGPPPTYVPFLSYYHCIRKHWRDHLDRAADTFLQHGIAEDEFWRHSVADLEKFFQEHLHVAVQVSALLSQDEAPLWLATMRGTSVTVADRISVTESLPTVTITGAPKSKRKPKPGSLEESICAKLKIKRTAFHDMKNALEASGLNLTVENFRAEKERRRLRQEATQKSKKTGRPSQRRKASGTR